MDLSKEIYIGGDIEEEDLLIEREALNTDELAAKIYNNLLFTTFETSNDEFEEINIPKDEFPPALTDTVDWKDKMDETDTVTFQRNGEISMNIAADVLQNNLTGIKIQEIETEGQGVVFKDEIKEEDDCLSNIMLESLVSLQQGDKSNDPSPKSILYCKPCALSFCTEAIYNLHCRVHQRVQLCSCEICDSTITEQYLDTKTPTELETQEKTYTEVDILGQDGFAKHNKVTHVTAHSTAVKTVNPNVELIPPNEKSPNELCAEGSATRNSGKDINEHLNLSKHYPNKTGNTEECLRNLKERLSKDILVKNAKSSTKQTPSAYPTFKVIGLNEINSGIIDATQRNIISLNSNTHEVCFVNNERHNNSNAIVNNGHFILAKPTKQIASAYPTLKVIGPNEINAGSIDTTQRNINSLNSITAIQTNNNERHNNNAILKNRHFILAKPAQTNNTQHSSVANEKYNDNPNKIERVVIFKSNNITLAKCAQINEESLLKITNVQNGSVNNNKCNENKTVQELILNTNNFKKPTKLIMKDKPDLIIKTCSVGSNTRKDVNTNKTYADMTPVPISIFIDRNAKLNKKISFGIKKPTTNNAQRVISTGGEHIVYNKINTSNRAANYKQDNKRSLLKSSNKGTKRDLLVIRKVISSNRNVVTNSAKDKPKIKNIDKDVAKRQLQERLLNSRILNNRETVSTATKKEEDIKEEESEEEFEWENTEDLSNDVQYNLGSSQNEEREKEQPSNDHAKSLAEYLTSGEDVIDAKSVRKEQRYICECQSWFCNKGSLTRHKKYWCQRIKLTKKIQCDKCGKELRNKSTYKIHKRYYCYDRTADMLFSCEICKRKFPDEDKLEMHKQKEHRSKRTVVACDICRKTFKRRSHLESHMINIHQKQTIKYSMCEMCSKQFPRKEHLTRHIREVHNPDKQPKKNNRGNRIDTYICDYCQKTFKKRQGIVGHMKDVHFKHMMKMNFPCSMCPKRFSRKFHLDRHERGHVNALKKVARKKKFACDLCSSTYADSSSVARHKKRSHSVNFKCEICNKSYVVMQNYVKHLKSHAVSKEKQKFYCDICRKGCNRKGALEIHLRSHSDTAERLGSGP